MSQGARWLLRALMLTAVLALAIGAAACGDDDTGSGSTNGSADPQGIQEGTGEARELAIAAGEREAAAAGGQAEVPKLKVGFIQILGAIEAAQRLQSQFEEAAGILGWEVVVCDAQGDPTKMARCGDTLLDQNVKALFEIGIEPGVLQAQLKKAKDLDVPVVQFGGLVTPDPLLTATYGPDEELDGRLLAEYLVEQLTALPDETVPIAVHDYAAIWGEIRTDQLEEEIKGTKVEIAVDSVTDAANLVEGTRKAVNDQLTANPDLKAFWFAFDAAGQAGAQAVQARFPGKEYPEKPLVATFHGDLGTLELMRSGAVDVVMDFPYDASAWIAVDQAAEYFARGTAMDPSPISPAYGGFEIYDYEILTKDNLPPEGEYRTPKSDFVTFFKTKWAAEFGK